MRIKTSILTLAAVACLSAQTPDWQDPARAVVVTVERSPLALVSRDCSSTEIRARGAAAVIDLDCRLELRNASEKTVRGAALAVRTLPANAGGRASVFAPSLDVQPTESFPIEVRVRLVRPLPAQPGALAEIAVDVALFTDLAFAGPDESGSSARLRRHEASARRDRERLRTLLAQSGQESLRGEMLAALERRARRPTLEARLAGASGRAVVASAEARQRVALALVNLEQSPIELVSGQVAVGDAVSDAPGLQIRNLSGKRVRAFEFAWLVADEDGRQQRATSVPFSGLSVAPDAEAEVRSGRRYELRRRSGGSFRPSEMSGFIRRVEFSDGTSWSASRAELAAASLLEFEPVTPEEQRLAAIYRRDGIQALVAELERMR